MGTKSTQKLNRNINKVRVYNTQTYLRPFLCCDVIGVVHIQQRLTTLAIQSWGRTVAFEQILQKEENVASNKSTKLSHNTWMSPRTDDTVRPWGQKRQKNKVEVNTMFAKARYQTHLSMAQDEMSVECQLLRPQSATKELCRRYWRLVCLRLN